MTDLHLTATAGSPGGDAPGDGLRWTRMRVEGWGMAVGGEAEVARARDTAQVAAAFARARAEGRRIALRGSGCSYGDASTNTGGLVLDMTAQREILELDAATGIARVQAGVTIGDLWRRSIRDRWWPAVVPGTMEVSVGGAVAMNIHGKNNFAAGTFGEHVRSLVLVTPGGETLRCSRDEHAELFHHAVGGFGMLGAVTEVELQLQRVHSGRLRVHAYATRDLEETLAILEARRHAADYLVGWVDFHGRGRHLGRGLVHEAHKLGPGDDPDGERMFTPQAQDVPARLLGFVPKGWLWPGLWAIHECGGIRPLNLAKWLAGIREARAAGYLQTHGAFHFLLDYVPRWKWAFKPGGLIQFQPFLPRLEAGRVLRRLAEDCHREGLVPYLGVLKRHRLDPFPMTHAVDGFSMAMDFAVTDGNRTRLWALTHRMAERVLEAGGRFYYAKDATLPAGVFERIHGAAAAARFRELRRRCDPERLLQTDLAKRLGV